MRTGHDEQNNGINGRMTSCVLYLLKKVCLIFETPFFFGRRLLIYRMYRAKHNMLKKHKYKHCRFSQCLYSIGMSIFRTNIVKNSLSKFFKKEKLLKKNYKLISVFVLISKN